MQIFLCITLHKRCAHKSSVSKRLSCCLCCQPFLCLTAAPLLCEASQMSYAQSQCGGKR